MQEGDGCVVTGANGSASEVAVVHLTLSKAGERRATLLTKAKRKSLTLAAVVSLCFAICWLPWCVAMLLIAFEIPVGGERYAHCAKLQR